MKSLRDQIDQKLKRINKAEGHKSLRRDNKGPLIVTSSIVDCLEGRERPKTIDSLRSKDTKKTEGKTKQRIASKYATSRLGHGNELMQTEDSDQPMRNVWNHGPSEASKREAEEIGNQLVDKILAQYGSHMSKRVDSDAFHRMRNYMNHRTQNNSSHQSIDEHEKIQKDDVSQKQFFSSDGFLDNDGDCFPKQYAPVAHSHKDIHDDEPTNNIKVRDVLQQVIRPQLALSGRKSLRQSERTLSNQSTLRNEVKIKDIVAKKQAINLYQSNGRSSFNPSISGQGSSLRHENISAKKQLSDVDSYASRFDETNERSIVDLNAKRVPVYTCKVG